MQVLVLVQFWGSVLRKLVCAAPPGSADKFWLHAAPGEVMLISTPDGGGPGHLLAVSSLHGLLPSLPAQASSSLLDTSVCSICRLQDPGMSLQDPGMSHVEKHHFRLSQDISPIAALSC